MAASWEEWEGEVRRALTEGSWAPFHDTMTLFELQDAISDAAKSRYLLRSEFPMNARVGRDDLLEVQNFYATREVGEALAAKLQVTLDELLEHLDADGSFSLTLAELDVIVGEVTLREHFSMPASEVICGRRHAEIVNKLTVERMLPLTTIAELKAQVDDDITRLVGDYLELDEYFEEITDGAHEIFSYYLSTLRPEMFAGNPELLVFDARDFDFDRIAAGEEAAPVASFGSGWGSRRGRLYRSPGSERLLDAVFPRILALMENGDEEMREAVASWESSGERLAFLNAASGKLSWPEILDGPETSERIITTFRSVANMPSTYRGESFVNAFVGLLIYNRLQRFFFDYERAIKEQSRELVRGHERRALREGFAAFGSLPSVSEPAALEASEQALEP